MQNQKANLIVEKTLSFSIEIIKFSEQLELQKKYVIAKQLLRSGTSIGANVWEAQNAESKVDFIHKMKIAMKESILGPEFNDKTTLKAEIKPGKNEKIDFQVKQMGKK